MIAASMLIMAGCGSSTAAGPDPATRSSGAVIETLGAGQLDGLPSGNLFFLVQSFLQPPGSQFPSSKHQQGFIYQTAGSQVETLDGGAVTTINAGHAYFQPSIGHTHANLAGAPNFWYFMALFPAAARGAPPVNPLAKILLDTQEVAPSALGGDGPYAETLELVTLQKGGHTAATRHMGLEAIIVLDQPITARASDHDAAPLGKDQGVLYPGGTSSQQYNAGDQPAQILRFYVTPAAQVLEVPVDRVP